MKKLIYFSVFFLVLIFAFVYKDKIATAVTYQAPTATLTADNYSISSGSSTTLRWSSTNSNSCTSNFGVIDTSGVMSVTPNTTTTYTIDCTDGIENATAGATVTVTTPPPPPQPDLCPGNYSANSGYEWMVTQSAGQDSTQRPDSCSPTSADPVSICGATTLNSSGYWYHWTNEGINVNTYYNCVALPPPPTIALEAAAGACLSHTIYLSWNIPTGATSFVLQRDGTTIYTGGATSFSDTTVTAGTTYNYSITAKNSNGSTIASDSNSAVGPTDLCANLSITAITPSNTTLPSSGGSLPLGADFIWSGANYFIDFGITLSKTDSQGTTQTTIYYGPSVHNNNAGGDITFSSSYNYPASTQTTGTTTYTFTYTGLAKSSQQSMGSQPSFTRTVTVPYTQPPAYAALSVKSNMPGSAFTVDGRSYTQQGNTYTQVSEQTPHTYSISASPVNGYSLSYKYTICSNVNNCAPSQITNGGVTQTLTSGQSMTVDITYTPDQTPQPDLTAGSVSPSSATTNQSVTLSSSVSNIGSASTGSAFPNIIQIATASGGGGTVTSYNAGQVGPITASGSAGISITHTFTSAGTYSARACADNPGGITESNEGNNCGAWTDITVTNTPPPSQPDLTAGTVSPTTATTNQSVTLTASASNIGGATTGSAFASIIQVATASNGGGTITNNATNQVGPLAASGSGTISITHTFTSAGTYSARACADNPGSITESNEGNNCGAWTDISVTDGTQPPVQQADLTAGAVTPTSATPGVAQTYTATITNAGSASTGTTTFTNTLQRATDSLGANATDIKTSTMSNIGAGASGTASFTSVTLTEGTWYLRACADTGNNITESNNNNNCGGWTQVSVISPNAPSINFNANPTQISPSQNSKLTWTTQNASSCIGYSSPSYPNWGGTSKATTNTTGENVSPSQNTTFTLTCAGNGYHATSTQVVTINVPTTVATITVTSTRATGWTLTGVAIDGSSDYRDTMTNTTTKTYTVDTKGGMIFNLDPAPISNNSVQITNTLDPRSGSSMTLYGGEHVTYNIFYSENSPMEYTLTNSGTSQATKSGYNTPVPAQSTIYAHLLRGTTQPVTISHGALPQGVTVESISNQGCSPDCAFVVNMLVASNAPAGSYPISIAGSPNATTTVFYLQVLQGGLLRVDCAPSSPVALVGQSVIWSANVSGGTAPYTYSWTGTGISTTTPPTTNPYEIRYSTTGVKNAYVSVRDSVGNNAVCNTSNVRVNFVPKFEEF